MVCGRSALIELGLPQAWLNKGPSKGEGGLLGGPAARASDLQQFGSLRKPGSCYWRRGEGTETVVPASVKDCLSEAVSFGDGVLAWAQDERDLDGRLSRGFSIATERAPSSGGTPLEETLSP